MAFIAASDAKIHLLKLLERVEKRERFIITRYGKPVAELIPVTIRDTSAIASAIADVRAVRRHLAWRGVRLSDVFGKGRGWRDIAHERHRYW
jgi:prevent-host-death family protein